MEQQQRKKQETVTTFAEVLNASGYQANTNRSAQPDQRPMLYFQGMKLYIPDGFNPNTLLKLLQVMKQL